MGGWGTCAGTPAGGLGPCDCCNEECHTTAGDSGHHEVQEVQIYAGEQAADSHYLGRAGRGDGHEHYNSNEGAPSFPQHCQSRSWGHQACCNGSTPLVWKCWLYFAPSESVDWGQSLSVNVTHSCDRRAVRVSLVSCEIAAGNMSHVQLQYGITEQNAPSRYQKDCRGGNKALMCNMKSSRFVEGN